jgi:hypothetical protein
MHQISLFDLQTRPIFGNRKRHSRTIGALGGHDIWRRIAGLNLVISGCGRTGSLVGATLARLGAQSLALIDPDRVEEHNLGEMDLVGDEALGLPKVDALAPYLEEVTGHLDDHFSALPLPISHQSALDACLKADVIFSCADNDAARLTAATVATLNHKVLVDVGTGIHFADIRNPKSRIRNRVMGADVRLILPGDGCLLCRGNITQYARAIQDVISNRGATPDIGWQAQRAGSLRSLNQIAAGFAVQMLQDLVAERIQNSLWAHIECDNSGRFSIAYPAFSTTNPSCPLCAKTGQGDSAVKS